jgi:ribosomal protein S18 acetylase RimI-like enzyme
MPDTLRAEPFTVAKQALLSHLHFGDDEWTREIGVWITGAEAIEASEKPGTEIWLYYLRDRCVGYGVLGASSWRYPPPNGDRQDVTIIPMLGLLPECQGKPDGAAPEERYSSQLLSDLLSRATDRKPKVAVLFVHPDNARAIGLYQRFGFENFGLGNNGYIRMGLKLKE